MAKTLLLSTLLLLSLACSTLNRGAAPTASIELELPTPAELNDAHAAATLTLQPASTATIASSETSTAILGGPTPHSPDPWIGDFSACRKACKTDGSNTRRSFPEGTTKIYLRWRFENIPAGARYIRRWTMDGQEWVRYECLWPGPEGGVDEVTLTEPDGLHSGTWEVSISVEGVTLLREQFKVDGNWTYWSPAGVFTTCYGKK